MTIGEAIVQVLMILWLVPAFAILNRTRGEER
jgi:hypothetical protein